MLPTSTQFRDRFVPEGQPNPETARAYYLAPLSVRERIRRNGSLLMERCGNPVSTNEIRAMMRKAIRMTRAGAEEATALGILDELEALEAEQEGLEANDTEGRAALAERVKPLQRDIEILLNELSREHRGLQRLLGAEEDRWQHRLYLGVQLAVRSWENVLGPDGQPAECAIGTDGLTEAALNCIPEGDVTAIARRVRELTEPSEGERKN